MLVCAFFCTFCTRDRGCSVHPVFPAPSDFRGCEIPQHLGRIRAARTPRDVSSTHEAKSCLRSAPVTMQCGHNSAWSAGRLVRRNISPLAKARRKAKKPPAEQETPAESDLSIKGKAYLAGIYEHPTRHAPDKSTAQLHAEVAKGALEDAGLTKADIDGYFCAGDAPGGVMAMVDYLGLKVRHFDSTETGGCSYLVHLGHAAEAIAAGKCSIALITLAGKPRTGAMPPRARPAPRSISRPLTAPPPTTFTACAPCAICMSSAPPASNWPGSRSRPRITRNTTRTRCCKRGRHGRGRAQLADDLRSAAPDGLLRRHRRRRRADRDHGSDRAAA